MTTAEGSPIEIPDLADYLTTSPRRGDAVTSATRTLREAILDGVLEAGLWLREESVSAALGISRTPVREAFNRLVEEGLVERSPRSGCASHSPHSGRLAVVYQVRGSLEALAASMAARRSSPSSSKALLSAHADMQEAARADDTRAFSRSNVDFHAALSRLADNGYLSRLLATVQIAIRRFGARTYSQERMDQILVEHADIVDAILANDAERASEAAARHAESARTETLRRIF